MNREFQFCKMKKVLEVDGGNGYKTMRIYLRPLNCTLKTLCFFFYHIFKKLMVVIIHDK